MNDIKVIQDSSCWDVIGSLSMAFTAILTLAILIVSFTQLKNFVKNNSIKTILDLESELNERKSKIDEISSRIRIEGLKGSCDLLNIYEDDLNAANENYLNALDRLCYCILKGYLDDRDWYTEYGDLIKDTIRANESSFGVGTYYKNIKKLYEKYNNC